MNDTGARDEGPEGMGILAGIRTMMISTQDRTVKDSLTVAAIADESYSWQYAPHWQHAAKLRELGTLFIHRTLSR